ncbi:hypothetical protein VME0621_03071 [Vibrio mediterranei]|uniref:hypothetical protein n=1 Tax=Vibrio mediterranei TaxID=689 RepID=UPI000783E4D3|nr:hypothetical protein [Vibrio mediterranei]MCG9656861.1 hypothetical protein [Vibrio mediterranei]MCG9662950.1 hypothetical protein [Vibrio mediterranei]SBO10936.1 hypothetical protein VME0621_03071 [Vibrio mediterranei]
MEVKEWDTPFSEGTIYIVDLSWNGRHFSVTYPDGSGYELKGSERHKDYALIVSVFHEETETLYDVMFETVSGFRLLDEGGLLELWAVGEKFPNCALIKGHQWSKESPITFISGYEDEWSHLMATSDECVEIVSHKHPDIKLVGKSSKRIATS